MAAGSRLGVATAVHLRILSAVEMKRTARKKRSTRSAFRCDPVRPGAMKSGEPTDATVAPSL